MWDYVYSTEEMVNIVGQKFVPKRNFIKRFNNYSPDVHIIDDNLIAECCKLQKEWCNLRDCTSNGSLRSEHWAVKEALHNYKSLNLFGIAVLIDGSVQGFAIGESLNQDTFVEHFEKGNTEFTGVYQFLLNELARSISQKLINREQDIGIAGLRKAKLSYHPVAMIEKSTVRKQIK